MALSGLVSLVLRAALQAGGPPGSEIDLVPIVRATEPAVFDGQAEASWSAAVARRQGPGFKRNDWNRRDKFGGDISDYFEGAL